MPRRSIIDVRAMLTAFGYSPETMTSNARKAAATRMEKTHGLTHFYMAGKKQRHYWRDEVEAKARPAIAA